MFKRAITLALALLLALMIHPAFAGKKKPKVKPYKSEQATIAVAHPVFYGNTGSVNNVTAQDFQNSCAIPASNGFDAFVFEVPAAYQKIAATMKAIGTETLGGYDLDVFFYDSSCAVKLASQGEGNPGEASDESSVMPAGTAFILVQNYLGGPNVSFHIELAPYSAPF
jgi:hypothetical protein